ncbi:replication protein P [Cronobacter sakazakii]|uniref:replication protein P n=1 Tax=Cronobacter sakazakii TaxID=28141 RepID=UPI0015C55440
MSERLLQAIANRDSQTLSRLANKYQPTQEHAARGVVNTEAERLVDALFRQLKQVFPASAATNLRTEVDEAAAKQQWIMAFAENGITSREQLSAGMKKARASLSPFWPSPGQFISWCREGFLEVYGLPTAPELVKMLYRYARDRGYYESAESYPWQSNEHYWMVTSLYMQMKHESLTHKELHQKASQELEKMLTKRINGENIPRPVKGVQFSGDRHVTSEQGLAKIDEIRKKFKLKRR